MNKHLNIFSFFNNNDEEYLEDNLSRAFALCLQYDTVLLDKILNTILIKKQYESLFNTDYPDYTINIDLQKRATNFGEFDYIYGVACSGQEIDISNIEGVTARDTKEPITDVSIEINNICIVFEFKRNQEDCSSQLKSQVEKIKGNSSGDSQIQYIDFNWRKIVKIFLNVLSLQRQINSENKFTSDFTKFLESRYPEWYPKKLLSNISFPNNEHEPNNYYLNSRLNQIKDQVAKILNEDIGEVNGKYYRKVVAVNWGWANEIHIDPIRDNEINSIAIKIYLGDTKGQGWHLYREEKPAIEWPSEILNYSLENLPYLKFSHFNSGLFWYCPSKENYKRTHTRDFFLKNSGRKKKDNWSDFEKMMTSISKEWMNDCDYNQKIKKSNRNYFDLSMGILLTVNIPFVEVQNLDDSENDSSLSHKISEIIRSLKNIID